MRWPRSTLTTTCHGIVSSTRVARSARGLAVASNVSGGCSRPTVSGSIRVAGFRSRVTAGTLERSLLPDAGGRPPVVGHEPERPYIADLAVAEFLADRFGRDADQLVTLVEHGAARVAGGDIGVGLDQ